MGLAGWVTPSWVQYGFFVWSSTLAPFGCADKPTEKQCCLICCKRKILFRLKKQAEKYGL
jgi:hypothetical protein